MQLRIFTEREETMARMPTASPTRHAGVTLVEMIVSILVLSILAAIATPAMGNLLEQQRAVTATNALITQLATARMTAISRRTIAVFCPSVDGRRCDAGSDWSGGWLLFLDRDGNHQPDRPEDIVSTDNTPLSRHLQLNSSAGRTQVRYRPDGGSAGSNLTVSICNRKGHLLSRVVVNNSGRARSERTSKPTACPT